LQKAVAKLLRTGIVPGSGEAPALRGEKEGEMHARSGTLYPRSGNFDYVLRFLRDTVTIAAQ
jgi:hypothetical protein